MVLELHLYQWGLLVALAIGYIPSLLAYQKQRSTLFFLGYTAMTVGSVMTVATSFNKHIVFLALKDTATLMAAGLMFGSAYIGQKRLQMLEEGAKMGGVRVWQTQ